MARPDISFIIPVYNGQGQITACLDSIYALGINESQFEIIVIDDASSDDTVGVVNRIASRHTNITLICQSANLKQGAARNRGLDVARGEYLTFVDHDDLVGPDVAAAIAEAISIRPDIYCGKSLDYREGDPSEGSLFKIITDLEPEKVYSGMDFCSAVKDFAGNNGTPWGYFFRLDYVNRYGKRLIEGRYFEETEWIAFHFLKAGSVFLSSKVLYYYHHNPSSVTMSDMGINYVVDSNHLACLLMQMAKEFQYTRADLFSEWNYYIDKNLLSRGIRLRFLMKYKPSDIKTYFKEMLPEDLAFLKENYRGNRGREFFFRHKSISKAAFVVICTLRGLIRKLGGKGKERINFYC